MLEKFKNSFSHFCKNINFAKSAIDANDINFMNRFNYDLDKLIEKAKGGDIHKEICVIQIHEKIVYMGKAINKAHSKFNEHFEKYFLDGRTIERKEIKSMPSKTAVYKSLEEKGSYKTGIIYEGQKYMITFHLCKNVEL